ncbi:MAG: hypothetical protein Q7S05_04965 [bacterium]|nr:hypothetical protein [bacterium]
MRKTFLDKLPEDFVPRHQWPEYDILSASPAHLGPKLIGENPKGMRWGLWPFYFEEYFSDKEPDMPLSRNSGRPQRRIVVWHRLTRKDVPHGWYQLSKKCSRMDGIAFISRDEDYTSSWSVGAQYDRRKWLRDFLNIKYKIEETSFPEFQEAYKKSSAAQKIGSMIINIVDRVAHGSKHEYMNIRCVRNSATGEIVAGIATITSKTSMASYYLCGFLYSHVQSDPLMTGLFDDWFLRLQEDGIKYVHMGYFWHPGKPKSWKGFSDFKAKFVTDYILHQPTLFRFAG